MKQNAPRCQDGEDDPPRHSAAAQALASGKFHNICMAWDALGITGHHWAYGAQNRPDPECQRVVTLALMEAAAKGSSKVKGSLPEMLLGPARISSSQGRTVPSHILSDTIYLSIHLSIYLSIYL